MKILMQVMSNSESVSLLTLNRELNFECNVVSNSQLKKRSPTASVLKKFVCAT